MYGSIEKHMLCYDFCDWQKLLLEYLQGLSEPAAYIHMRS
jgi:hypothetical protein